MPTGAAPGGRASRDARKDRLSRLILLWQEGVSVQAIADRFGLVPSTVSKLAASAGLTPRHRPRGGVNA